MEATVFEGVMIGVISAVATAMLIFLSATIVRLWHSPKRLDRLDRLIPTMARALLVLLQRHVNDSPDSEAEIALTELKAILTDGAVSQRAGK
jgi:hypothetical protein